MASDPAKPRFLRKSKISLPPTVHVNKEFLKSATGILKIGESVSILEAKTLDCVWPFLDLSESVRVIIFQSRAGDSCLLITA